MRERIEIVLPTIHWNGSSAQRLYDQYDRAADAVREALNAVIENGPNPRDYYIAGTWERAVEEHRSRLARLNSILGELEAILEHVAEHLR